MLKSYRLGWGGGVVVAHEILVSAQAPSVLGFWVWGLRVLGLGLTIFAPDRHTSPIEEVLLRRKQNCQVQVYVLFQSIQSH